MGQDKLIDIIHKFNLFRGNYELGTDKEFVHKYISNFYQKTFEELQLNDLSLLEIGISTGASLKMWKEFFVNGKIYGIDCQNSVHPDFHDDFITYYIQDAYDKSFVDSLCNFDIIIDDGPHTLSSQLNFINLYYNKLNPDGFMIIEDIDCDNNINHIVQEFVKIFDKHPIVLDERNNVGLSNEVIIYARK